MAKSDVDILTDCIRVLSKNALSPLDLLPHSDLREKCIDLVFNGIPGNIDKKAVTYFHDLRQYLTESRVDDTRIVVFGGGSGLSNIVGGDSRHTSWRKDPFSGLKGIFPKTRSIICVTDDGGSTGELIKDLPLIALGDIRHVLLSSIQFRHLQNKYGISYRDTHRVTEGLYSLINHRFKENEITRESVFSFYSNFTHLFPKKMHSYLASLMLNLFEDERLTRTLTRAHCLGNLLLVSAIYSYFDGRLTNADLEEKNDLVSDAILAALNDFSDVIGAHDFSVLPSTSTPSQLRVCYTNGVQVTGECKSSSAERGFPVARVIVDFSDEVLVHEKLFQEIESADIIILAPGSLYSSIIPIFQVPGIADAVRKNSRALKLLISNLWVQAGETDISISDPERKFHVSDMIRAYELNIPGGTRDLFQQVLCLSLKEVPASILQNYAIEGKMPIYLDKEIVRSQGFIPIECGIYSKDALSEIGVIKHDPELLSQAVKTIFLSNSIAEELGTNGDLTPPQPERPAHPSEHIHKLTLKTIYPSKKYRLLEEKIQELPITFANKPFSGEVEKEFRTNVINVIWKHQDIPLSHLEYISGFTCIEPKSWRREQVWDKVYSFFDPEDGNIKIRADQLLDVRNLEIGFLIALGQSLLGNYAEEKKLENIEMEGASLGKIYHLYIREEADMNCYFSMPELDQYLKFARMVPVDSKKNLYTRVINGQDGFTPPGILMGLLYAWYLDNRLASHIEYKMALMKISRSDLIPEQLKMLARRNSLIQFFREVVFSQ